MVLCDLSAAELSKKLRSKEISAKEIVSSVLNRIEEKEETYNIFLSAVSA